MTKKKPKKSKKPEEVCKWTFQDHKEHFSTTCNSTFPFSPGKAVKNITGPCPNCDKKIKLNR